MDENLSFGTSNAIASPGETFPQVGASLPRRGNRFTRLVTRLLLALVGWRVVGAIPDIPKMLLIGAPHTSNWDFILTLATMFALGVRFSWMAKDSVFRWPIAGLMRWLGGVPVNRRSSQGYVEQVTEQFQQRKTFLLAITPEGTRQAVAKWRSGFYHMAQSAGVPILLGAFDFGAKAVRLGPLFIPSGDYTADLHLIQSYYAGIRGKFPQQAVVN